jgi:hypothetical protein|tara:strand:- start:4316 stop:5086 length:771 start_codon:yes stop_codon:yes gene_type:complete
MDIAAIKARLGQLQQVNNRTSNLWKPTPGKTQVRIVPYKFNKDNPFIELYFHYDMGDRYYLSPQSFGRPDPIEEFATKLKTSGNNDDYKLGKRIEAKMRTFAPVIVRGEENEGVKFWGFGKTVYQELLSIIADPDYGDITDPVNGRDIVVEFKTSEETGRSFPMTSIRVKPNQTPVTENVDEMKTIKDTQRNITEIYNELSYDDLNEVLQNWLNQDSDTVKDEDVTTPVEKKKATTMPSQAEVSDVSSAFDELFSS